MNRLLFLGFLLMVVIVESAYVNETCLSRGVTLDGVASWYSEHDRGIRDRTANMEVFDDRDLTCAMWRVPFGTWIKVTNTDNNRSIIVRVNDRGPAKRLVWRGRIVDLTKGAFSKIANPKKGLIKIKLTILSSI